ncbi:Gustatory receptor 123, partial [Halyomorpha halys]
MKSIGSSNCLDGFKKTLRMSRFYGIMPLDEQCHLGPVLILITIVIYLLQLVFISAWFWLYYVGLMKRNINNFLTIFRMCCSVVSLVLISFRFAQKREELKAIMWSLTVIDKALYSANLTWKWSIHPFISGGNLVLVIVPLIINSLYIENVLFLWFVIIYTDLLFILLGMNQFCSFLSLIEYCLKLISCSKNPESFPKLYSLIECFWQILNDIYGPAITCIILTLHIGVLHLLYNMFSADDSIIYANGIALVIIYCMVILQIILTCQKLTEQ